MTFVTEIRPIRTLIKGKHVFRFPMNDKLALPGTFLYPIEAHIDGFRSFLLYCAFCETFRSRVSDADWSWWLWVTKFLEGSAYRHGLLAIMKSGTNFGFSGGRHHVVEDLVDGMDSSIKRGIREGWLGRVSGRGRTDKTRKLKNAEINSFLLEPFDVAVI